MNPRHHHDKDKKAKCKFSELLCVEFEAIFNVDVEIDNDSIVVTCGNRPDFDVVAEQE